MVFDWFKNKKEDFKATFDPADLRLIHMVKGAFVDYDLQTWEVKEVYQYDWGNDKASLEFQLDSGTDILYLLIKKDDELKYSLSKIINIRDIPEKITIYYLEYQVPPMELSYEGVTYFRKEENTGLYRKFPNENNVKIVSWTYYNQKEDKILMIDQWTEKEFEVSAGIVVQEYEFSNIIRPL